MTYSFDYDNVRFLIIDLWVTPSKNIAPGNGYNYGYSIAENHQDGPFQGNTYANPDMHNAFLAGLMNNDVKYYISGHDHIHQL